MTRRLTLTVIILAVLATAIGHGTAATIDGIAATVNGEVITLLDLEKAGQPVLREKLRTTLKRERAKVKREALLSVLDDMVLRILQQQRARELGLRVNEQEIDTAVMQVRENNSLSEEMMARALKEEGLTFEKYREQISEQILFSKLMQQEIRARVTVTDEETEEYYVEHQAEYYLPARIRVRHLLVKISNENDEKAFQEARNKAFAIIEEVRGGAGFAELVMKHSPETASGGETISGWLKRGEFLQELEETAFSLPAGSVSKPIRSSVGFHIIEIVEKEEASYLSLETVSEGLREKMLQERMKSEYEKWLEELREEAHVQILY
jgi:peptidyl-prolyl cis-trans isomerase SurA